jgi:hypothetical protein
VKRERRVSSSSTGEERRGEALGRRSPDEARDGEGGDNGEGSARTAGRGAFGQGRADMAGRAERASGAVRSGAVKTRQHCRDAWARCPDSGFKPLCRRGTWRPHGSGVLPRGPGAARDG